MVRDISSMAELNTFIASSDKAVVDFYRPEGCIWCKRLEPHFLAASDQLPGISFGRVDVEEVPAVIDELQLKSVPTVLLFDGTFYGIPVEGRTVGAIINELS